MRTVIDKESGFCFGVKRAISTIERELAEHSEPLHCVGDIVHNEREIERLQGKGLVIIDSECLGRLPQGSHVLFRAHGEPPASYGTARDHRLQLTDATCPVVLKLQQRIKQAWLAGREHGVQIVLFGKKGHAEVKGLMGQTDNECILIENIGQVDDGRLVFESGRPIEIFAQTTKDPHQYADLIALIRRRADACRQSVCAHDTICRQMADRADRLRRFAGEHDMILFVGGTKSSNSKVLFDICRSINEHSYFVTGAADLRPEWLCCHPQSIGIFGATSTPLWLMEQVQEAIESMGRQSVNKR